MARFLCPLQQQNVGRKENTERESDTTLKLCGLLRTPQSQRNARSISQTYPNMGCVNTLMLDFEIALNYSDAEPWCIWGYIPPIDVPIIQFMCVGVSICVPQGVTVQPHGDREV